MKMLDELIKAEEICSQIDAECSKCPYGATAKGWCEEKDRDALHYLKEYREKLNILEVRMAEYKRGFEQLGAEWSRIKDNPPLTWSELLQMKGKPVWLEDNLETPEDITKYWAIMWRIEKAEGDEYALLSDFYYQKSQYGKNWQAYRKERL